MVSESFQSSSLLITVIGPASGSAAIYVDFTVLISLFVLVFVNDSFNWRRWGAMRCARRFLAEPRQLAFDFGLE